MFMVNKRFIYNSGTPRSSQTNDSDGEYVHAMHMHEGCQSLISGDKRVRSKNNLMCSEWHAIDGSLVTRLSTDSSQSQRSAINADTWQSVLRRANVVTYLPNDQLIASLRCIDAAA